MWMLSRLGLELGVWWLSPMILAAVFSQNSKSQQKADFREKMTYFFGFYGPKIGGGGSSYPAFVQKYQKP